MSSQKPAVCADKCELAPAGLGEFAERSGWRKKVRTHLGVVAITVCSMEVRAYRGADCGATRAVFERAVRLTAAADYSPEQVEAWAPTDICASELAAWGAERERARTVVAVDGDDVLGFSDLVGRSPARHALRRSGRRAARGGE